jgi:hypothetical protein
MIAFVLVIARRRQAQGHEWPRSLNPSWGDSSTARRPAHRQENMAAHPWGCAPDPSQGTKGEEKEVVKVADWFTLGRRWSRSRLDGDRDTM